MTNGPRLRLGRTLAPGVFAVALFAIAALVVLEAPFDGGDVGGFAEGVSITAEIGYALFGFYELSEIGGTEPFLVSVVLVAVALDAALDAALVLAKREEDGEPVTALAAAPDETGSPAAEAPGRAATDGGTATDSSRDTETNADATGGDGA
ncbi:hypothetical protein ACFQGT_06805 [Natrialbaceae archaeon GCM10025810]|uniref:hypothetical protein n=1 Tax=Halovalidus salilacus TaxID=3075124 RepID=UPI003613AFB2